MPPFRRRAPFPGAALLAAAALAACAGPTPTLPAWTAPEVRVDGAYGDWDGRFTRIHGKYNVGLAVARDATDLYLCLVTRELRVQSLLEKAGFTIWFDPAGGRTERLGVRVTPREAEGEEPISPRVEIVFDGAEYGYQLADATAGGPLELKAARHADVLVYELRATLAGPMTGRPEDAARATLVPGATLGVGLVTEELPPPEPPPGADPRVKIPGIDAVEAWVVVAMNGGGR